MPKIRFDRGEVILAELSPSRRSVLFPVLELILATGVVWLLIGLLDTYLVDAAVDAAGVAPDRLTDIPAVPGVDAAVTAALWVRRLLLVLWVIVAWRRCLRHLVFRQRSRMILTDRRLITASGQWRSRITEIPLDQVVEVSQHRGTVSVWARGYRAPVRLTDVPYAAQFAAMLSERSVPRYDPRLPPGPRPVY